MRGFRLGKEGFSIIEVIVTVAVVGVAMAFIYTVLYGNWIGYNREIVAADTQFDARLAMDKITKDIRESEDMVLKPESLTLTLAGVDVVYTINANNQLTRQEGNGPARVLCESVNRKKSGFSWAGPRSIDIDIKLEQPEGIFARGEGREVEVRFHSSAQQRNLGAF